MSFLHPWRQPERDPRFDAVLARHAAAQQRVVEAAEETAAQAEESQDRSAAEVSGMIARTAERRARRGFGRTMADAALEQIEARIRRDLEGYHDP